MDSPTLDLLGGEVDLHHDQEEESRRRRGAGMKSLLQRHIQVTLSRPIYRPGRTVVGTIRVSFDEGGQEQSALSHDHHHHHPANTTGNNHLHDHHDNDLASFPWKSISLYVIGYCRLDNRWHKTENYFESYPVHDDDESRKRLDETLRKLPKDLPDRYRVFWAASSQGGPMLDLLGIPERDPSLVPLWGSMRPRPIRYTKDWADQPDPPPLIVDYSTTALSSTEIHDYDDRTFTFRAVLPDTLPSTLSMAVSCRYSYAVLLRAQTQSGTVHWMETPIVVQRAAGPSLVPITTSTTYGLAAQAHTGSLPCYLTATELNGASPKYQKGSLSVHRFSAAFHINAEPGPVLRVTDPYLGQPVAILTILAPTETVVNEDNNEASASSSSQSISLCPGSRLYLQFDFPSKTSTTVDEWAPCYQISACLQGEEFVLTYENSGTAVMSSHSGSGSGPMVQPSDYAREHARRTRAQHVLLSTAHEVLDPETTQRVSLPLLVPDNAMCSAKTREVEIAHECIVDIVVANPSINKNNSSNNDSPNYRNLRLQLPCTINHTRTAEETMSAQDPDEEIQFRRQKALWHARNLNNHHHHKSNGDGCDDPDNAIAAENDELPSNAALSQQQQVFPTEDIWDDLKRLSIVMAEENGWTPQARP